MDVSIIIVNYNSIDLTIDCVNSIFQQTADVKFEIIIVDNASKNKEAERLQAEFENSVKMIEAKIKFIPKFIIAAAAKPDRPRIAPQERSI